MVHKFILIGRPYSNGGDYLIFQRIQKVIESYYPEAEINVNLRNDNRFDVAELNEYAAIVTGGGGAQLSEQYLRSSFLYEHIDELTVPVHYMGTGMYGADGTDETVYGIEYTEKVKEYFRKVTAKGGQIASRDWTVDTVLRNNHIEGVVMAGCPAWYDLEMLQRAQKGEKFGRKLEPHQCRKIAVSNHGLTKRAEDHAKKLEQIERLIMFLQEKFEGPEIFLTFNDGYITKYSKDYNLALQKWAEAHGVTCVDLSDDAEKFKALEEIDFHVGFRVHTHIYCISRWIPSILIEEDIRGYGMNETLQLPNLTSYGKGSSPERFLSNDYLISQLRILLEQQERYQRVNYIKAYELILRYYETGMKEWLRKLGTRING